MTFSLKEEFGLEGFEFRWLHVRIWFIQHIRESKTVYRMVKKINEVAISQYEETNYSSRDRQGLQTQQLLYAR